MSIEHETMRGLEEQYALHQNAAQPKKAEKQKK